MDTVFINQLTVETVIGLYPWEQQVKQPLAISVECLWDNRSPAASGDLRHALDYAAVIRRIEMFAKDHPHQLLECFAEALAQCLIAEFAMPKLRLRVAKTTTLPQARAVGITIERTPEDFSAT